MPPLIHKSIKSLTHIRLHMGSHPLSNQSPSPKQKKERKEERQQEACLQSPALTGNNVLEHTQPSPILITPFSTIGIISSFLKKGQGYFPFFFFFFCFVRGKNLTKNSIVLKLLEEINNNNNRYNSESEMA